MNEINSGIRVFVDSNILISAMHSEKSLSRELLLLVSEKHQLSLIAKIE
jgi:predicted nucleic acid-binding protein